MTVQHSQKSESRPKGVGSRKSHETLAGRQAWHRRKGEQHTSSRAPSEHASTSATATPVDTERLRARPHGGMRRRRRALTHSLRNRRIMRQAHVSAASMDHAHVTRMHSETELAAKLRHDDAARLRLRRL